jgi:hypothetical protein
VGDARVQEEALDAVSVIAGLNAHRADLVVVVAPVVRVLDSVASQLTRERAAWVLCRLTDNSGQRVGHCRAWWRHGAA